MATGTRLYDLLPSAGDDSFYKLEFRSVLEYSRQNLIASENTRITAVTPAIANQFVGDMYGLLTNLGVAIQYQWITMRCNDLTTPLEYTSDMVNIIIPSTTEIDTLQKIWVANNNLSY